MRTKALLQYGRCTSRSLSWSPSWLSSRTHTATIQKSTELLQNSCSASSSSSLPYVAQFLTKPTSSFSSSVALRFLSTKSSAHNEETENEEDPFQDEKSEEEEEEEEEEGTDGWEEEEDETEPEIGDGGDGGGVVLRDVPWGERVLSIAHEVLLQLPDDMKLFAFKTSPRGYIYVRLDKLSAKYGCPSMEEIENYSRLYKQKLEEIGESGEIPDDLALEVSSPSAERLLKVPDDLDRFKDMPMRVSYLEGENKHSEKDGVFLLESVETEAGECVWRMADVKENRDMLGKGRPLGRKQKDWRLRVPFEMVKKVTLYLEY